MARVGWQLFVLALCGALTGGESQDTSETPVVDVLTSLSHLTEALSNHEVCKDRLETFWSGTGKLSVILEKNVANIIDLMDDITRSKGIPTVSKGCGEYFTRHGHACYSTWHSVAFPWWRSRFVCWMVGGELVPPKDLEDARDFLKDKGNHTYWIGARTSPELEFPDWISVEGDRVQSENETIRTIPRSSKNANCLSINGNNSYQMESLDCEEKFNVLCKKNYDPCSPPFKKAGNLCLHFHGTPATWREAKETCNDENGVLVFQRNFQLLKDIFATEFQSDDWAVWTAGKQNSTEAPVYNALNKNESVAITWSHDTSLQRQKSCIGVTGSEFVTKKFRCDEELPYFCSQNDS